MAIYKVSRKFVNNIFCPRSSLPLPLEHTHTHASREREQILENCTWLFIIVYIYINNLSNDSHRLFMTAKKNNKPIMVVRFTCYKLLHFFSSGHYILLSLFSSLHKKFRVNNVLDLLREFRGVFLLLLFILFCYCPQQITFRCISQGSV